MHSLHEMHRGKKGEQGLDADGGANGEVERLSSTKGSMKCVCVCVLQLGTHCA